MTSSKSRRPCSNCGRVHSSSRSEAACKASPSSKSRFRSHYSQHEEQHHRYHHHHHKSATGTGNGTRTERAHRKTKGDVETGRHPSSSLGPGFPDPVIITVLVLLGISSVVMLAVGIWLLAASNGWPLGLNISGNIAVTRLISFGLACLLVGLLLIPVIVLASVAASTTRGGTARVTRLSAVFLAALVVLILLMMSVTGILFATIGEGGFMEDVARQGWVNSAQDANQVERLCRLESEYECRGWELNSCTGCQPTVTGDFGNCTLAQREICPRCFQSTGTGGRGMRRLVVKLGSAVGRQAEDVHGCREFVFRRYREFFIPFTVYTIFLALLLVLLSWKTCIDSTYRT